jgi:hypothetical protein
MALTLTPYTDQGVGINQTLRTGSILVPAGSNDVAVYITTPAELYARDDWGVAFEMQASVDGGETWYPVSRGRAEPGRGSGAIAGGMGSVESNEPGALPANINENFEFAANNSAFLSLNEYVRIPPGSRTNLSTGTVRVRMELVPLGGNPIGNNVLVAVVVEAVDLQGVVVPIDPATRSN